MPSTTSRGSAVDERRDAGRVARAHARTGDPVVIAAYLGRGDAFDWAMGPIRRAYADQNQRDPRRARRRCRGRSGEGRRRLVTAAEPRAQLEL